MPKYFAKKRSSFKPFRSYRRKANWLTQYKPRSSVLSRPNVGLGRSVSTRLRTSIFYTATTQGDGKAVVQLYPGSCYNPMGSAAAIQPALFDQWSAMFARYVVTGATVKISVTPVSDTRSAVCAAYPSTVDGPSTATATFQGYASQAYAQSHQVVAGAPPAEMFFKLSSQKILGSRLPVLSEDHGALVSASPTTGQFVTLPLLVQCSVATPNVLYQIRVDMVQDVTFDQRVNIVDA